MNLCYLAKFGKNKFNLWHMLLGAIAGGAHTAPAAGETPDPANAAPSDTQHLQTPNTWPCAVGDVLPVSHVFIRAQRSDHNHPQMAPASVLGALRARM